MSAFRTQHLKPSSFMGRFLGKETQQNGFVKINNLLAQQQYIYNTPKQEMYRLVDTYGIHVKQKADKAMLLKLYARLFYDTLGKPHLFDQRIKELKFLKDLFAISDRDAHVVHKTVVQRHYQLDLDQLLSMTQGSPISEVEEAFLRKARNTLLLPEALSNKLKKENPKRILEHVLQPADQDVHALSAEDLVLYDALHDALGIQINHKPNYVQLHKYCLYYCIENERMPSVLPPSGLAKGELCYLTIKAEWFERKRMVRYIHYGGLSLPIKTMQGVYWKTPLEDARDLSSDVWQSIDKGDMYITNKSLMVVGEKKLRILPLNLLSNFNGYKNGVEVQKKNGTSIFFRVNFHSDLLCLLLGKVLEES